MDMLRVFFEKTEEDTSVYFRDKNIWQYGEEYRAYQGKYPVIFISFKDVKFKTWEETYEAIRDIISKEAYRHTELRFSDKCSEYDKNTLHKLIAKQVSQVELSLALADLSRMLHEHYNIEPIIIIDEYDIPIQQGHTNGFYDEVILFMRNLFSGGLKDNKHLSYGFLTGYLKVAADRQPFGGEYMCEVALPNKEISSVYSREILSQLQDLIPTATAIGVQEAIYQMDSQALQKRLGDLLLQTISFHDTANENFYHGLVLGLCAMMDNYYHITSNRESGEGRYDTEMKANGIQNIYKYGVAFCGKNVEIVCEI